jgi:hypothetical protein
VTYFRPKTDQAGLWLKCSEVQCSAVQCSAVRCSTMQYSAVPCSAVQCSAVQCTSQNNGNICKQPSNMKYIATPSIYLSWYFQTYFHEALVRVYYQGILNNYIVFHFLYLDLSSFACFRIPRSSICKCVRLLSINCQTEISLLKETVPEQFSR